MELIPYPSNDTIVEYETVWFRATDESVSCIDNADYGINVWYNEDENGLWQAMPIVPIWRQESVTAPMLFDPITGETSESVISAAHAEAQRLLAGKPDANSTPVNRPLYA